MSTTMNKDLNVSASATERSLFTARLFDAPRERVFDAWTDPAHISNWWGPRGFTTTTSHMDMRPGGEWIFVMHGPDGRDYANRVEYVEVERPARLAYRHSGNDDAPDNVSFFVTIDFIARGAQTEIQMRMVLDTDAMFENATRFGAIEGLNDTMTRFGEHLATR